MVCVSGGTSPDTENDFLLAQMIQLEYDKEYDRSIDSMEKRYNGESKGIVRLLKYFNKLICIGTLFIHSAGLLIFRAVAELRNSDISAESREIHKKKPVILRNLLKILPNTCQYNIFHRGPTQTM